MDLLQRIERLEARARAERAVYDKAVLCDYGPYPPEPLARTFEDEASFQSGEEVYRGRQQIYGFYNSLATSRTVHWYTNVVVTLEDRPREGDWLRVRSAVVQCYGYEAPTIHETAVVGAFLHRATCEPQTVPVRWSDWRQEVLFLSPLLAGFGNSGTRRFNQSMGR